MRLDVITMEPRYRRFRAELRFVTRVAEHPALFRWMRARRKELAVAYLATGEGGGPYDYIAWVCAQYVRTHGIAL